MPQRHILLTPGPSPVPEEALRVMAEPIYHHRTPRFRKLFRGVSEDLKLIFRTKEPVFTLAGSGTLAMEASVTNLLSPGDCVIVLEAGKFGERWGEIAKRCGLEVVTIKAPYGDVISAEAVREALGKQKKAKAVFATLCETSTGTVFGIERIAEAVSETAAILAVDAISGLAADRLEMDDWGVDVVVCGSQKGLMLPPGLAFIALGQRAWKMKEKARFPCYYTDLARYRKSLAGDDTPFTGALTLVLALERTLARLKKEGMEAVWNRSQALAEFARRGLKESGFALFSKAPSNACTAAIVPERIDGEKLVAVMRDQKGVTLAGGQGSMKGKIVRIAHFGFISKEDIKTGLSVLAETVKEFRSHGAVEAKK